jgi:quinoprotein glucose dehydrogenase
MMGERVLGILGAAVLALALVPRDSDWPVNGGRDNIRYSPLTQINRKNVSRLQVAWTYDSHDAFAGSEMQSNPVVVDGVLYATTPTLKVVAVDAASGGELWMFDPGGGTATRARFRHRGVTVHKDRVFVSYRNFLWAIDKRSGRPIASFGTDGRIDLREGLGQPAERLSVSASTPGAVFDDLLIMGSTVPETLPGSPGHIRAFDVNTGKLRWIFHTIPQPGEFGYDTWPKEAYKLSGGANAWAGVTVDARSGVVFAATGSASFDFYGVTRHGDDLFANCVIALDARTGKRLWHFQGVRHDVWDWDFPAAPSLVTLKHNGRPIEAVAQITKYGYVYVFDRRTGESLFPIEHRKVPSSDIDGEQLAATQPYRRDADEPDAGGARRCRRAVQTVCQGLLGAAVAAGHDCLSGLRRRRRVGWRGIRSRQRSLLRELERDALDRQADPEQRCIALQQQVRDVPPGGSQGIARRAVARTDRGSADTRGNRRDNPPRYRSHAGIP